MQWTKEGIEILTPAALREIKCLLVQIRKGCLSGIPPGHGTNRNERLHRDLNRCFGQRRYGVELAYGLISSILFEHNEKIMSLRENQQPKLIYLYNGGRSDECFGLLKNELSNSIQFEGS